ncbi:DNA gyrase subunit A, partial [bacterium]|nr:DNA gyrase subunit A [bacterium]
MEESFLDYAMSVIVSRAIPDARDGLKPIHRRILWAMQESGFTAEKTTAKSAKIVGEVMGNYHPHGNEALYEALVRLGQEWSLRYPLITPQGNFGSIDGDPPAAMRYTEAKLSPLAAFLLEDVKKDTVDWVPTFDPARLEPTVLPAGLPNLLMNGSEGIAVGMATRIPPHNLRELSAACIKLIDDPAMELEALIKEVPGPDFPTAGLMLGNDGAVEAYRTGRGTVPLRGRAQVEQDDRGRQSIIISELPYQVNKSTLIEKIAHLAQDKKLLNIRDIRDESDRSGIRIVIELASQAQPQVILNNLYKQTQLQVNYSMIMLALRDGVPKLLNLKQLLSCFVEHRREVVRRRSEHDKAKAELREHILEGLTVALNNLDEVVKLIKESKDPAQAKEGLVSKFSLSEVQAQAILEMKLSQLTGLEQKKILDELGILKERITKLKEILADPKKLDGVVKDELLAGTEKFGDERRTVIAQIADDGSFSDEDLIRKEDVVVTLTRAGYLKRIPASTYRSQGRGGRGLIGQKTKAEDIVRHVIHTNTHDTLLCFTSRGVVHSLRVYMIPAFERAAKGLPVVNLLSLMPGESLTALIPLADFSKKYLFMCTARGTVKRTELAEFSRLRVTGKRAIGLGEGDSLAFVIQTSGSEQVVIITRMGCAVKFDEDQVRAMGTAAAGVRGVSLQGDGDRVVGLDAARDDEELLVAGQSGYGKRSKVELFRKTKRGAKGVIALKVTERTGPVVGAVKVSDADELLIITRKGMIIRTEVKKISLLGRITQGVKLINLREGDSISAIEVI